MNIIDLDQVLIVDPRPFLRAFYKRGKPAAKIAQDDYVAWNDLIEQVILDGWSFQADYSFIKDIYSQNYRSLKTVDLLDEHNNVVVTVNPKNGVWFQKDRVSYVAFGPFVVRHFIMPLLHVSENHDVEDTVDESEGDGNGLEYLDEVV